MSCFEGEVITHPTRQLHCAGVEVVDRARCTFAPAALRAAAEPPASQPDELMARAMSSGRREPIQPDARDKNTHEQDLPWSSVLAQRRLMS